MTTLYFHKMHGLGNDFMIINGWQQKSMIDQALIPILADRYHGVGFDQLLWIGPSKQADVDCLIFNADGNEAEQCGNGMRCIARFVHEEKIITKQQLTINTKAGVVQVAIQDYDFICANMGVPQLSAVPIRLSLDSVAIELMTLSLGNPHAIYRGENIKDIEVAQWGALISKHDAFSRGVNIGFMKILNRKQIQLRTYERGVGETRACGSNACAAAIAGIHTASLDTTVEVQLSQGILKVEWQGNNHPVFLTGPAARVFSGSITLP